jgi:hypothetical protein
MHYESEWLTRKQRLDARPKKPGWEVVPFSGDDRLNYTLTA